MYPLVVCVPVVCAGVGEVGVGVGVGSGSVGVGSGQGVFSRRIG